MSFLYNPMVFYGEQPSTPQYHSSPKLVSNYPQMNQRYQTNQHVEFSSTQFKVFAFDKLNRSSFDWSNASSIYRFELNQQQSFGAFLNVLKSHSIGSQTHKFYYLDDEQDLVILSTEADFRYMLQILKGKVVKIACEKISSSFIPTEQSRQTLYRNLPFFMKPFVEEQNQQPKSENLIEQALDSIFSGIFREEKEEEREEKKQEESQRIPCMFPFGRSRQENPRVRTINLADLLNTVAEKKEDQKEEKKEERKEEKTQRSFEDYLAELFGKKLAKRKQEMKEESTLTEQKKESPVLRNCQIISNYLLDESDDEEDESLIDSDDDQSSVFSEQVNQEDVHSILESFSQNDAIVQYKHELALLASMGFIKTFLNAKLLSKYNGDIQRTIDELIHQ